MGRRRLVGAAALVALVGLVAVGGLWLSRWREPEAPPPPVRIRPITSDPGLEDHPALSPDGNLLAFVRAGESGEAELCVKQVDGGGEPLVVSSGRGAAITPTWSPDGQQLATCEASGLVRLWDAATGKELRRLGGHMSVVTSVSWSRDGKTLASGSDDKSVRLWDPASGKELS